MIDFQWFIQFASWWGFLLLLEYSSASYKYNSILLSFFILLVLFFFLLCFFSFWTSSKSSRVRLTTNRRGSPWNADVQLIARLSIGSYCCTETFTISSSVTGTSIIHACLIIFIWFNLLEKSLSFHALVLFQKAFTVLKKLNKVSETDNSICVRKVRKEEALRIL